MKPWGGVSEKTVLAVAPYAGAWIETNENYAAHKDLMSLPTRERGLKLYLTDQAADHIGGRSLRGSVD